MKQQMRQILRMRQLPEKTGLSKSTIYERIKAKKFPRPFPLGARARGYLVEDIDAWIDEQRDRARDGAHDEVKS